MDESNNRTLPTSSKFPYELASYHRSDFQVGSMIGQGSFATVHKAKELATGRDVALKIVRPENELDFGTDPNGSSPGISYQDVLKAMKLEVQHIQYLGIHPCIVQIFGIAEDCRVFAMERAATDLFSLVKQQPNLPLVLSKQWIANVLMAIEYMHQMGIVHQDIKSSNILIFSNKAAKVCDFGLARKGTDEMEVDRELVTLWYRPPELLMGASSYSPKVDEWGVGCIALEMIVGSCPFKGKPECTCTCPDVTHRNYNGDQLMKIFAILGTPKDKEMLSRMACACHFSKFPAFPRKLDSTIQNFCTIERVKRGATASISDSDVKIAVELWTDLISGLLHIDPSCRSSASEALRSKMFERDDSLASPTHSSSLICRSMSSRSRSSTTVSSRRQCADLPCRSNQRSSERHFAESCRISSPSADLQDQRYVMSSKIENGSTILSCVLDESAIGIIALDGAGKDCKDSTANSLDESKFST